MERLRKFESPEQKNKKTVLKVFLQRHGPKMEAAGEKNEKAPYFKQAVEKAFDDFDLTDGEGLVHVSASPVERAYDTAVINKKELSETDHRQKERVSVRPKLVTGHLLESSDERYKHDLVLLEEMQMSLKPAALEYITANYPDIGEQERRAMLGNIIDTQILSVLFNSEQAAAAGFQVSCEEMAGGLAQRYSGFLRHSGLLEKQKEGSLQPMDQPYVQVDVSHSYPIMCFLKEHLVFEDGATARDLSAEEFFARTGGVIPETGKLEMDYESEGSRYLIKTSAEFVQGKKFRGVINFS